MEEGIVLLCLIVEYSFKNDELGDFFVFEEYIIVFGWVS